MNLHPADTGRLLAPFRQQAAHGTQVSQMLTPWPVERGLACQATPPGPAENGRVPNPPCLGHMLTDILTDDASAPVRNSLHGPGHSVRRR